MSSRKSTWTILAVGLCLALFALQIAGNKSNCANLSSIRGGGETFSTYEDGDCASFNGYSLCTTLGAACHQCENTTVNYSKKGIPVAGQQGYILTLGGACGKKYINGKCKKNEQGEFFAKMPPAHRIRTTLGRNVTMLMYVESSSALKEED